MGAGGGVVVGVEEVGGVGGVGTGAICGIVCGCEIISSGGAAGGGSSAKIESRAVFKSSGSGAGSIFISGSSIAGGAKLESLDKEAKQSFNASTSGCALPSSFSFSAIALV